MYLQECKWLSLFRIFKNKILLSFHQKLYNRSKVLFLQLLKTFKSGTRVQMHSASEEKNLIQNNPTYYGDAVIHNIEEGNKKILELLQSDQPCMISRFGSTELSAIYYYYKNDGEKQNIKWPDIHKEGLNKDSGFFPSTDEMLSKFCSFFMDQLENTDMLGVWYKPGEDVMVKKYMPRAYLTPLRALEPYYFSDPWSRSLKNKKVLVVHPFAKTINHQYQNFRENLFSNDVLPGFTLEVIEAVQSLGTTQTRFTSWFEAYDYMCNEIKKKDFDIAIIGAGAYGLPLASFVKSIGKKAVHLGGATQILFGIKGRRWDNHSVISLLYNEYWVRPSETETPAKENLLEDGCYW